MPGRAWRAQVAAAQVMIRREIATFKSSLAVWRERSVSGVSGVLLSALWLCLLERRPSALRLPSHDGNCGRQFIHRFRCRAPSRSPPSLLRDKQQPDCFHQLSHRQLQHSIVPSATARPVRCAVHPAPPEPVIVGPGRADLLVHRHPSTRIGARRQHLQRLPS
ncbi:hypothetical protein K402DRAFT_2785 [Aulographum hederae CBS 113979]|uniref:Uncharacterized protein n=1 Tax=Aulographum hederae CBS 113979 TaxID=1176131 RepID=A0A6G1HGX9_9PEZI|nr:hypothetical protein K402DRAFT_2785 [Aulographum hederae CBS 113979]